MATYNTPFYLTQDAARTNTSRLAAPNVASGDVEFAVIKYTIGAGHTAGQTIALCALPAGCIPLPQLSSVTANTDPTSNTLRLDIGTAQTPAGWADDIVLSNGGQVACTSGTMPAWIEPTPLGADAGSGNAVIICTIADATGGSPDAGDILYFTLAYKRSKG